MSNCQDADSSDNNDIPSKRIKLDEDSIEDIDNTPECLDSLIATEKDVGITEFISSHAGFKGIFGKRFSDFLVNEILLDGQVVHLTNFDIPKDEEIFSKIHELFGEEKENKLKALVKAEETEVILDVTNLDKDNRRNIHESIRQNYPSLRSNTKEEGEKKLIVVIKSSQNKGNRRDNWPPRRGAYLHCSLYKENKDTMEAIAKLAGIVRMNPSSFYYAGTKDRRGKTLQKICAYHVKAETMVKLNSRFKNSMTFGDFEYKDTMLKIGDLMGNKFSIILRDVVGSAQEINEALESLKAKGFINYFGMQRFGTTSIPTHRIGCALILGKWEEAINLILQPRSTKDNLETARKIWQETKDAQKAWAALPYKSCIEGHLLKGLKMHNSNDFVNALNMIPRNTRLMYLHSYQSFVWNHVVSKRILTFGLKPCVGDLWLENTCWNAVSESDDKTPKEDPKVVTQEDIESNKVSIYNIVLPLPGYDVTYPQKEVLDWYKEILAADGLDTDSFRTKLKNYSVSGAYRYLLTLPKDLQWTLISYNDPDQDLILSDLERLQNKELNTTEGSRTALKLELNLPSSSYATMALREALKTDTSIISLKNSSK